MRGVRPVLVVAALAIVAAAAALWWTGRPISYTGSPVNPSGTGAIAALPAAERTAPPQLVFTDAEGKPQALSQFSGKVLLVNLWATWCPPCVAEMPAIARLSEKLGGERFQVVAIALDRGGAPVVARWFERNNVPALPIHLGNTADYQGALLPTSYLIDKAGKVAWQGTGARAWDGEEAMAVVRQLAAE